MSTQNKIDVCMSPSLYEFHKRPENIVVVIDIVRATSSICTAFETGVEKILPLSTIEEAFAVREQGYLLGGERGLYKVEGFDFGNSPYEYTDPKIVGKKIALTTTNGTYSLNLARETKQIVIGAFINSNILTKWLIEQKSDVLLLCAGTERRIALEDVVFAGKIASALLETQQFTTNTDSTYMSIDLYEKAKDSLFDYIIENSRLKSKLSVLGNDIRYCLSDKQTNVIPVLKDGHLVNINYL